MAKQKGRRNHPPEVKAAVLAQLMVGRGVEEIAKEYNLPHSTVSRWRDSISAADFGIAHGILFDEVTEVIKAFPGLLNSRAPRLPGQEGTK